MASKDYARTQGIQLLTRCIQEFGPIFTLEQTDSLPEYQDAPPYHTRKLISKLAQAGWIEILKRGVYVVVNPLYAESVPAFAIANALVQPMAISHWSALTHHGFTTQNPPMIQASTPVKVMTPEMRAGKAYRPRGRAVWQAHDLEFEYIYTQKKSFWGFQKIWVNSWTRVNITDPERTALDLIIRPDIFGGMGAASEILEEVLPNIDAGQLVAYALKYAVGTVIKRLGWLLEKMGTDETTLSPLKQHPVSKTILLDSARPPEGKIHPVWNIRENRGGN